MSTYIQIFIQAGVPIDVLASQIGRLLSIQLEEAGPTDDPRYEYAGENIWLALIGAEDFVNDRDKNFEDYNYYLDIGTTGPKGWQEKDRLRLEFARSAFDKLRAKGSYPLLMVREMQEKLDEYIPPGTQGHLER